MLSDIVTFAFILQIDQIFSSDFPLLQNVLFALNLGDDEIGFETYLFRDQSEKSE